ncbi:hypothetical protein TorRG33x02_324080, partial [Trema orientale]
MKQLVEMVLKWIRIVDLKAPAIVESSNAYGRSAFVVSLAELPPFVVVLAEEAGSSDIRLLLRK